MGVVAHPGIHAVAAPQGMRGSAHRPGARMAGFTVVELVVAMTVAAILAVVAVPSFNGLVASQRVKTLSFDLYVAIAKTRSSAKLLNQPVTLIASPAGWAGGWTIQDPTNPNGPPIETHDAASGVAVASGYSSVTFNPNGRLPAGLSPAPSFVVQVTGSMSTTPQCVSIDIGGRPYAATGASC